MFDQVIHIATQHGILLNEADCSKAMVSSGFVLLPTVEKPKGKDARIKVYHNIDGSIVANLFNYHKSESILASVVLSSNSTNTYSKTAIEQQKQTSAKKEQDKSIREIERYNQIYNGASYCTNHPYWTRKIPDYNISLFKLKHQIYQGIDYLMIPIYNQYKQQFGYQRIAPDGKKRNRGDINSHFWMHPLNNPEPTLFNKNNSFFILGEGLTTVISAKKAIDGCWHSQIYLPICLVSFGAHNLLNVIEATKHYGYPYLYLVDNDASKPQNTGINKAREIINKYANELQIYPLLFDNNMDCNDFINTYGDNKFIELLLKHINFYYHLLSRKIILKNHDARQSLENQILERNPMNVKTTKGLESIKLTNAKAPAFHQYKELHDYLLELSDNNIGHITNDTYFEFTHEKLANYRYNLINYKLEVLHKTSWISLCEIILLNGYVNAKDGNRYHKLYICCANYLLHEALIPVDLGHKYKDRLYSKARISKNSNSKLNNEIETFILECAQIINHEYTGVNCRHNGWLDDNTYFYPNVNLPVFIGINNNSYYYDKDPKDERYIKADTLTNWQNTICKYATGNEMLEFSICTAFVGFLMRDLNCPLNYGFHLYSYEGGTFKTTCLKLASSVVSNIQYSMHQWKQTANSLEAKFAFANDSFIALDEIKQLSKNQSLQDIIMLLGNGKGSGRMDQNGVSSREILKWRTCYLSSGNYSTTQIAHNRGLGDVIGAEETRLYNLSMPDLKNLHDLSKSEFATKLSEGIDNYYGIAGYTFITNYLTEYEANKKYLLEIYNQTLNEFNSRLINQPFAQNIHSRIIPAFVNVAVAGLMAKHLKIIPNDTINPTNTVFTILQKYLGENTGNKDHSNWLNKLYDTISTKLDKHFICSSNQNIRLPHENYGFYDDDYIFFKKVEFAKLFNYDGIKQAKNEINFFKNCGVIIDDNHRKQIQNERCNWIQICRHRLNEILNN